MISFCLDEEPLAHSTQISSSLHERPRDLLDGSLENGSKERRRGRLVSPKERGEEKGEISGRERPLGTSQSTRQSASPRRAMPFALFHFVFNSSQFHCQDPGRPPRKTGDTRLHPPLPAVSFLCYRLSTLRLRSAARRSTRDWEFIDASSVILNAFGEQLAEIFPRL